MPSLIVCKSHVQKGNETLLLSRIRPGITSYRHTDTHTHSLSLSLSVFLDSLVCFCLCVCVCVCLLLLLLFLFSLSLSLYLPVCEIHTTHVGLGFRSVWERRGYRQIWRPLRLWFGDRRRSQVQGPSWCLGFGEA